MGYEFADLLHLNLFTTMKGSDLIHENIAQERSWKTKDISLSPRPGNTILTINLQQIISKFNLQNNLIFSFVKAYFSLRQSGTVSDLDL